MQGRKRVQYSNPTTIRQPLAGIAAVAAVVLWGTLDAGAAGISAVTKGMHVPPLPANTVDIGSYLVNPEASVEYTVAEMMEGERKSWWLKKRVPGRVHEGKPVFEIVDVMAAPELPKGHYFMRGECRQGGKLLPDVIVAVRFEEGKKELKAVSGAWRVDVAGERINTFPVDGIVCPGEGGA